MLDLSMTMTMTLQRWRLYLKSLFVDLRKILLVVCTQCLKVLTGWTVQSLLPLFMESAHTVAMISHSMDVVKNAVEHLNPG